MCSKKGRAVDVVVLSNLTTFEIKYFIHLKNSLKGVENFLLNQYNTIN